MKPALLLAAAIGLVAGSGSAAAQATSPPQIAFIAGGDAAGVAPFLEQFKDGMRQQGQREGETFRLQVMYANRDTTRTTGLIREAAAGSAAVIVVAGLTAARSARDITRTIPIVVVTSSDMVDAGVIQSLARPGGNVTGLNDLSDELAVKRLELLRETLPRASRVALLVNPDFPATGKIERRVRSAATRFDIELVRLDARDAASLARILASLKNSPVDAVLLGGDALFTQRAKEVIEGTRSARIPLFHYWPGTAEMGALLSHQADIFYNYRRAAYYVDRILKGAKPGDLPVEQPTRYELVVSKKVARELDIAIPQSILVRADKVIE